MSVFSEWWQRLLDSHVTEIGRDGVEINSLPYISASGNLYWNVRDIIFKPAQSDRRAKQ